MELKMGDQKVVLPETRAQTDAVVFGCGLEGCDNASVYLYGCSLGIMVLVNKIVGEALKHCDGKEKSFFLKNLAETIAENANGSYGVEVILMKRPRQGDWP